MTAAIIGLVIWVLIFLAVPFLSVVVFTAIGGVGALKGKTDRSRTGAVIVAFIITVLGALTLWVLSAINAIVELVTIIQLLAA